MLTIVFDNGGWDAVEKSALSMYPATHTAEHITQNRVAPLSSLQPVPEFTLYAKASGGHTERVDKREDLLAALQRAMHVVRNEHRQALVHVLGG